ncbi:KH domain-containing protein [Candidatus Dojkabacteria bacterium]|nr:KH domain-containing protein [Candidatus Dojkabacteria bacterium]
MQDLIEFIVKKIVNYPDEVTVSENIDEEQNTIIHIDMNPEDKPIVIGKGGRNISAVRDIASVLARQNGKRVYIKIDD